MVSRTRVLHLGPEAVGPGGMAGSIRRMLESPLAATYEMEAVATWRPDARLGERAWLFARSLIACVRWSRRPGPGVVHVHMAVRGSWYRKSACVLLGRALRRPVLLQLRCGGGDIRAFDARIGPLRRKAFGFAFRAASRVVSVSGEGAEVLERRFGCSGVDVVTNPAPVPAASTNGRVPDGGAPRLLYLGGFKDAAKGADVLVSALPALLEAVPDVRVTLAGPGEPSAAAVALITASPAVEWVGWLEPQAKAAALASTDLFVLPSVSEGMPNAMLEAMAFGRATVVTRVGGVPDVVTDDVDGVIVEPGDSRALAGALTRLLGDADRRERLGATARGRAERLTRDEVWGRLDEIYEALARGGPTVSRSPMLDRAKGALALAIRWGPLPVLVRTFWARRRVSILFYHEPDPEVLERHLEYLSRRYRFVSLRQAVDALEHGDLSSLPARPLVVTLDDGHRRTFDLLDLFRRFDVRPTIYLCSQIAGTARHFWFTEARAATAGGIGDLKRLPDAKRLQELQQRLGFARDREYAPETRQALNREEIAVMRNFVDFEAHTRYHPVLPTCSDRECEDEIAGSRSDVNELAGGSCAHFSYPNGDYGERERALARNAGYRSARSIDIGWNGRRADRFALRVLGTPDDASVARLAADLSGFGLLLRLRGGSARGRHRTVEVAEQ